MHTNEENRFGQANRGTPQSVLFAYWGRRGLSRLALEVARAAGADRRIRASFSISRQNDRFADFAVLGDALVPVDTFASGAGAILCAWRAALIRRRLLQHVSEHRPAAVIELMPHVWSALVMPALKARGVRYATIVHDAAPHPGDQRSVFAGWFLRRSIQQADVLLTLSRHVAESLQRVPAGSAQVVRTVFLPDLGAAPARPAPRPGEPWRLLFLGRILPYKGLHLFVETVEELSRRGIAVEAAVYGEGDLGNSARRLGALGAEVVNRWLTDAEIESVLARFHAVVLSHVEASQSGIAAAAAGAGLPAIATPVGGIVEQVVDGVTGVQAARVDALALADAAVRLMGDPSLYARVSRHLTASRQARSVQRFVELCVSHALRA